MRYRQSLLLIVLVLISCTTIAQTRLSDSPRMSPETFVYKLSPDDMRDLMLKDDSVSEKHLHSFITSFPTDRMVPETLLRGNYLFVNTNSSRLQFEIYTVDDLHYSFLSGDRVILSLYTKSGEAITGAKVKVGGKQAEYDPVTMTYAVKKHIGARKVLEIDNNGVWHYINLSHGWDRYSRGNVFSNYWHSLKWGVEKSYRRVTDLFKDEDDRYFRTSKSDKYKGFMVFNKPKYRPGETVKMKTFLMTNSGKPVNKPLALRLYSYQPKIDTILAVLSNYTPGGYVYEFKLDEGLKLTLDKSYSLELHDLRKDGKYWDSDYYLSGYFSYEDYELKKITFEARSNKEIYQKNDAVSIFLKAVDENGLSTFDGKVSMTVFPGKNQYFLKDKGFIPELLYRKEIDLSGGGEKEVILPDSIFPADVSMDFLVQCTYLGADNEKKDKSLSLFYKGNDYVIDFAPTEKGLLIRQLKDGASIETKAKLTASVSDDADAYEKEIMLPAEIPVEGHIQDFTVKTEHTTEFYFMQDFIKDFKKDPVSLQFMRYGDTVRLDVSNPHEFPLYYTIWKKGKVIEKGCTPKVQFERFDRSKDDYFAQIEYLFAGKMRKLDANVLYPDRQIVVSVNTPAYVYPGQKTNMELLLTDALGEPVKNADVTAYAYTSKFPSSKPSMPYFGNWNYDKRRFLRFGDEEKDMEETSGHLDWQRWKTKMNLDTIEYYKFLHPAPVYTYSEPSPNDITQISPYALVNGYPQGVYTIWIDEQPRYFRYAQQLNNYSFRVSPGVHSIRMRTSDREIRIDSVYAEAGKKTIISVDGSRSVGRLLRVNKYVKTKKNKDDSGVNILKKSEAALLDKYMLTVANNFPQSSFFGIDKVLMQEPATIKYSQGLYYINPEAGKGFNTTLVGPFPDNRFVELAVDGKPVRSFEPEGGYEYTVRNDFLKMKSWTGNPVNRYIPGYTPDLNFKDYVLTEKDVADMRTKRINNLLRITDPSVPFVYGENARKTIKAKGLLKLSLGKYKGTETNIDPKTILILDKSDNVTYLYRGNQRIMDYVPEGEKEITLVFDDNSYYKQSFTSYSNGLNYLSIDSIVSGITDDHSVWLGKFIEREILSPAERTFNPNQEVTKTYTPSAYSTIYDNEISGKITDSSGDPLIGVTVVLKGTSHATITDIDGLFRMYVPHNAILEAFYVGFEHKVVRISDYPDRIIDIQLQESSQHLEEVVVVGYGTMKKQSLTGSVATIGNAGVALQGRVAGIQIRGMSSMPSADRAASQQLMDKLQTLDKQGTVADTPIIILNGLPYSGRFEDIDQQSIVSIKEIAADRAIQLYGAQGKNGVIVITTAKAEDDLEDEGGDSKSLRRNFRDDAFWQPTLRTDDKGKVSFEVTYPDDITSWNTNFLAVGKSRYTGEYNMTVKSFKATNAQLYLPRFSIEGDSINGIGKLSNYMDDTISVKQTISVNGIASNRQTTLAMSHVDTIPMLANVSDSITIRYTMQKEDGFFDGEERKVPVYPQGTMETNGSFKVISDNTEQVFDFNPAMGKVTLHAEASSLDLFLREIQKVDIYPYLCNEQMASKLKALFAKKRLMNSLNEPFDKGDIKKVQTLINRLNKNKNADNLWGWWNKDKTTLWISKQVVEAMLMAEKESYTVDFNKQAVIDYLVAGLNKSGSASLSKADRLRSLEMLKDLNANLDFDKYLDRLGDHQYSGLSDRLSVMRVMQLFGREVNIDTLMWNSHKTIMGGLYWGDLKVDRGATYYSPVNNNVQYTLQAYRILRNMGGHEKELEQIRSYFFEMRRNGSWSNTYESANIIETIMPDMLTTGEQYAETGLQVDGKAIDKFPYTAETDNHEVIVKKSGTLPVFFTGYQQYWNKEAKTESKGFTVTSEFRQDGVKTSDLTAGKAVDMEISVWADSQSEYVMLEIPIPAGCSYENKSQSWWGKEIHREYFKEKVTIFCNQLEKGQHKFNVRLIPRYTGRYHINPARAELMYFPVFYGREGMKETRIK